MARIARGQVNRAPGWLISLGQSPGRGDLFQRIDILPGVVKNNTMMCMPAAETIRAGGGRHRPTGVCTALYGLLVGSSPPLDGHARAPSAYFHRPFWATFETDRAGLLTRILLHADHLMWGANYPHTEGTFPRSREQIAEDFAWIPEAEVYKIVMDNAAQLHGL